MLWISPTPTDLRQGLTRRDWLRVGVGGGFGSLLGSSVFAGGGHQRNPVSSRNRVSDEARNNGFGRAKSCILLYLFGGVSQLDVWDLKPGAPDGIRGEFRPISTSVPGVQITEYLPRLAQR